MGLKRIPGLQSLWTALSWAALLLFSTGASALGLGEITVHSHLGGVLQAEVQIVENSSDSRIAETCFRLSRPAEPDSGIPTLTRGRITIERQGAQSKLSITSDQLINEPVLQINLRAGCGAEVVRSYTVLIDPEPLQNPRRKLRDTPATPIRAPLENEKQIPSVASSTTYPKTWETGAGESAISIAKALFPRQPKAQSRFLASLKNENPLLDFGENGDTALTAGTSIIIPDTRRSSTPKRAAEVSESPDTAKTSATAATPLFPAQKVKSTTAGKLANRLVISGDSGENATNELPLQLSAQLSTQFSERVSENTRAVLRIEYRLLNTLYAQASQQLELAEQVRNLENSLVEMRLASENAARAVDEASRAAQATTQPIPVSTDQKPVSTPTSTRAEKTSGGFDWWQEILVIVTLIGAVSWGLRRRANHQGIRQEIPGDAGDDVPPVDTPPEPTGIGDPWAEEERKTIQRARESGAIPDIVIDGEPTRPALARTPETAVDAPKHVEFHEANDCNTTMELAEIMICFGRVQGAIQALEEFLASNPDSALAPWLKLLEIYRMNDMQAEFESTSAKLRTHFNVAPSNWEEAGTCLREPILPVNEHDIAIADLLRKLPTIGTMPHIVEGISRKWDSAGGLAYLEHLLRDTRDGQRGGFPLAIARELLFLTDLLKSRLQTE